MAVKRAKKDEPAIMIPAELEEHAHRAFSLQAIEAKYEEAFKGEKAWIKDFLETTDQMTVDMGEGFKTADGRIVMSSRENWTIDTIKIEAMIKTGEISMTTILAIAKINAGELKKLVGEAKFAGLAVNNPTEYLSMTATPAFKAEIDEKFQLALTPMEKAVELPPFKATDKKAVASVKESLAKAKAAQKKIGKASPQEELDAILGG